MKAAIYARVSTEEQAQNFSIGNQVERLRKYCSDKEYPIVEEYVDAGYSGTTLKRPALTKMMDDARAKLFDAILVYKLDRLFRSNRHMYNTIAEFEDLGIQFASVTESFDTTTAMGKAYLGMASTFAEWERNTFMERSRDGMRKAIQSGQYSGGIIPYGYQLNPDTKKLEINEEEAKIVRQLYYWVNEKGMTCYSIAPQLNALGIPTRYSKDGRGIRGKATARLWRPARVYNMLRNSTYKGEWVYGKRSKKRLNSPVITTCPSIVDSDTFNKARNNLKDHCLWADRNSKRLYLLRGLVKCEICGHSYSGYCSHSTRNGELQYYRCNRNGNRGNLLSEACDSPSVPAKLLEDWVWEKITNFVKNPETVRMAIETRLELTNDDDYRAQIDDAEKRLEELIESEKRLLRLYADPKGQFSKEALDSELEEIVHSREIIKKHISALTDAQANEKAYRKRLENIGFILGKLNKSIQYATPETKRAVIENLLLEVRVGKDDEGNPAIRCVFAFDENNTLPYNNIENEAENHQLCSARMSVRLLRRPRPAMHLPARADIPLPATHQRTFPRPRGHFRRSAAGGL
ncbi:MAG: recombinase family protein [Dehalococcoidales bacterium]|nr:recombinase family protein [Dehalococcoidales bacterium]